MRCGQPQQAWGDGTAAQALRSPETGLIAALASTEIRNQPCREQQDMAPDLTIDVRALARRAAPLAALVAVAVAVLVIAGGPLQAFADALRRAASASPGWVAAAAAFEVLSFAGYVLLLWLVGGRATRKIGLRESVHVTLGGAAATRLLPTAGVGGAALTLWALRRAGLPGRQATRTLLTFLVVLYSVFLSAIAVSGALIATGAVASDGPLALSAVPAAGAALAIAGALALAAAARRPRPAARPAGRLARMRSGGL